MAKKEKKGRERKEEEEEKGAAFLTLGKYDTTTVEVKDPGLKRYINLTPMNLPHTAGRFTSRHFAKSKMTIVERLINNMMRTEHFTGKKTKAVKVVRDAFEMIEKKAKKNPVQVLVDALQNAAPREEITRLKFGGISVPKAVDIAPSRRLDIALRNICKGAVSATYKKRTPIHACLANEILLAAKGDMSSFAIQKKDEIERVAASAR